MNVFEDNPKNIYVIKHRLSELKKHLTDTCFHYHVGNFIVKIFTHKVQDQMDHLVDFICDTDRSLNKDLDDCITRHEKVDVNLYEWTHSKTSADTRHEMIINLDTDPRFKDFEPICHTTPVRYHTGIGMPIINLCELIRYLHRLSQSLSAFY